MKVISGTFNGTGATLRVGIGFIPDYVILRNIEDGGGLAPKLEWSVNAGRAADQEEGVLLDSSSGRTELTSGNGVAIYRGTPEGFSSNQTAYVQRDIIKNKASANVVNGAALINRWSLDTAASLTGSWNAECNTTYVGEGSRIAIRQDSDREIYWASVTALTSNGDEDDEVTLNEAIGSGDIEFLQGMYDYVGVNANVPMKPGFVINSTADINTSGEMIAFEAGQYDNDH